MNRKKAVRVACECAKLSLAYNFNNDPRPINAIKCAESWLEGNATTDSTRIAARESAVRACEIAYSAESDCSSSAYHAARATYSDNPKQDLIDAIHCACFYNRAESLERCSNILAGYGLELIFSHERFGFVDVQPYILIIDVKESE